jgi:ATP-binding protein involved in chromosome partitioning
MTNQELINQISKIYDPSLKKTLGETGGIESAVIKPDGVCEVVVNIFNKEKDEREVRVNITKLLKVDLNLPGAVVTIKEFPKPRPPYLYLGITSGKGGVGKSTVTVNLAVALNQLGIKTAIIDADIYGASIPFILDIKKTPVMGDENELMIPLQGKGIEVISTEFFMPDDKPLMWRGPLLNKMLTHYFNSVRWADATKLILIDLPPGTGDVAIDINKFAPQCKMIIVTTPSIPASKIAVKAGIGAQQIGHEIIGVIENMSYYLNPVSKEKDYIFGTGGGIEVASKLDVPLIGEIPINYDDFKETVNQEYEKIARQIMKVMDL